MLGSNNAQKVSLPMIRPSSGQQKKPTGPSKMEVLPPEKTPTADFSKPQLLSKKETKLERIGSSASKKSNKSINSSVDITSIESSRDAGLFASNGFNNSSRSQADNSAVQEELKKISSKPFNIKSKQKKISANLEESAELNQSSRSTNLDASHPNLSTPAREMYSSTEYRGQGVLTNMHDTEDYYSVAKLGLESTPMTEADFMLYDNDDYREEEKEEEQIDININFADLQKKFDELAKLQKEREEIAREYVSVISNRKSETGESLVTFPANFAEIVKATVEEAKSMEELKEQGIMSESEIERFIMQKITSNLNNEKKTQTEIKKEKEDPYVKEKEKIKELDRILAQKEKEYRDRKNAEKMKRLQDLESMDESEISVENIDKIFLTEQHKRKSRLSTSSKSQIQSTKSQAEEKVEPIKPNIPIGKSHIKKNIETAFSKTKESLLSKLTEADQKRLEELMSVIEATIDGNGSEEEAMRKAVPNPYDEGERMQEINKRLAAYSVNEKIEKIPNILDVSKLPKEKSLRENAEKRALQERNEAITKKLMEMNNKEKLNEVFDSNIIIALVEQLKKEHGPLPVNSNPRRDEEAEELEKRLKEIDGVLATFNEEELLQDLGSLSQNIKNVKQKLKLTKENIEGQNEIREALALLTKKRTDMLENLTSNKEALNKLEQNTVQNDLDALAKLEKKLILIERSAMESEENLRKSFRIPQVEAEVTEEPEMTIEEYDKQITAQLKILNPELFAENVDNEPGVKNNEDDDSENQEETEEINGQINYEAYNPVEEEPQEDEEDPEKPE